MTHFAKGDTVVASLSAQGMVQGSRYEVVAVEVQSTPFGEFVTYGLRAHEDALPFAVRNAHVLCWKAGAA